MKRIAVALVALSVAIGAHADQAAVTKKLGEFKDLVGYWTLDGNLQDSSGNAHHGKIQGDPAAFTWVEGVNGGKALHADTARFVGSYIDIAAPIGSKFDSPKASCVVWATLEPRAGNYWHSIVERNNLWYVETETKPAEWKDNAVVVRLYDVVAVGGGGSGQIRDNTNVTVKDGVWAQYGWSYDGSKIRVYLNGTKVLEAAYAGGLGPTKDTPKAPPADKGKNYNLSIATWQQRDDWFKGAIDAFAYITDVLTDADFKALNDAMNAPLAVEPKGKAAAAWGGLKQQ
ncbi:LamG domain-containing protein [Candidatus Poribacteria bacterium]|nr:LamG domain-containing protein [Candidatus Poribacteria bacterium]